MLVLNHTAPLISLVLEFAFTLHIMRYKHVVVTLVVGLTYLVVNMAVTLGTDNPVYDIITWKDIQSPVLTLSMIVIGVIIHCILTKLSINRERRNEEYI